jgi:formate-dependent nitrite reductase membrane component NrfD
MAEQVPPQDGRYIDPERGALTGEAAEQRVRNALEMPTERTLLPVPSPETSNASEGTDHSGVWRALPSSSFAGSEVTYYDRPLIKEPVWLWSVPLYFYTGGTAGAAAVLGGAAQLTGNRHLVRRCRWVAAVGTAASSLLLIHDLGRPERFLNMLRVVRPTSPMSIGSWVLAGAGGATMGSALLSRRQGWLGRVGDIAGLGGALLGLPLAGYTAVLLANTAVPLWQSAGRAMPPLFAASAVSGAASFLELLEWVSGLHGGRRRRRLGVRATGSDSSRSEEANASRAVQIFGLAGKTVDLVSMVAVERETSRVEIVGQPLREGVSGALWQSAKLLTGASLGLSVASLFVKGGSRRQESRRSSLRVASAVLGTAGALALRFGVFHAGKASARQPRASFQQQRSRLAEKAEALNGAPGTLGPKPEPI